MTRLVASLLALCCSALWADYLEVSRAVTLKAGPDGGAEILERLDPGAFLPLLEDAQTNGYYFAQSPGTVRGWVYRTFVRRYLGEPPKEPDWEPEHPLADRTAHFTGEQLEYARRHLAIGKPQAVFEKARQGYVVGYDARLKIPVWVQYEVTAESAVGPMERTDDFRPDMTLLPEARSTLSDYSGSGFDRGHMAPAADMRDSESLMSDSFLLSNMTPQVGIGFNRHIWSDLEAAVRGWAQQKGRLFVIAGPVFAAQGDSVRYRVVGGNQVAVPTHFYKIVAHWRSESSADVLAFMLPNEPLSGRDYSEFLTTVDAIERATGLDFLNRLADVQESQVEATVPASVW